MIKKLKIKSNNSTKSTKDSESSMEELLKCSAFSVDEEADYIKKFSSLTPEKKIALLNYIFNESIPEQLNIPFKNPFYIRDKEFLKMYEDGYKNEVYEMIVMNDLKKSDLMATRTYVSKKVDPRFYELFSPNPIYPAFGMSPTYSWDILVRTIDGDILVDVDGPIHNEELVTDTLTYDDKYQLKIIDYIRLKELQRLYQTDGLQAYTIRCINGEITDETPVIDIYTNKEMTYKSFIGYLEWTSLSIETRSCIILDDEEELD
jgi:hypothetical protein